jgi:hypothetical protein
MAIGSLREHTIASDTEQRYHDGPRAADTQRFLCLQVVPRRVEQKRLDIQTPNEIAALLWPKDRCTDRLETSIPKHLQIGVRAAFVRGTVNDNAVEVEAVVVSI